LLFQHIFKCKTGKLLLEKGFQEENMSKKKGKKRQKKTVMTLDPKDYEGFTYGPLKFERFGRIVKMSSKWADGKFDKYIEKVRENRPKLKDNIKDKIKKIDAILDEFDPLELVATVSVRNCFVDPENYSETKHKGREAYIEYALSFVLSKGMKEGTEHATKEAIEEFNSLIEQIFMDVPWYFGSEKAEGIRDKIEDEIRFKSILRYLLVRGDSIQEHHIDLFEGLFKEHDDFLKRRYGFDTKEFLEGIMDIENQVVHNIHKQAESYEVMKEIHESFNVFIDKEGHDSFSSIEDCMRKFKKLPEVQEKEKKLERFANSFSQNPFEVGTTEKVTTDLLEMLSANFGDNEQFLTFEKSPGWPTNDSIIYEKPLIKHDGKYYCFAPQITYRRIIDILETWIQRADPEYCEKSYKQKRAKFLEEKALEYLGNILKGADIYHNLQYESVVNGKKEKFETDGLILYDENILIFEAKAGHYTTSARRGGLLRIKSDTKKLLDNAYEQALRTKKYITETEQPVFESSDRKFRLKIADKSRYKKIYLLNVTLENLGPLATQLNSLKSFDFIQGKEWPWSIFLNDLRVISELIECPSEFFLFLQRRIRANDYPQFKAEDELDLLMFFFNDGLYLENGSLKPLTKFTPFGYTESIDRYYDFLAGRVSSGNKPRLKIDEGYRELIKSVEATGKEGFTRVGTFLLNFSSEAQRDILKTIKELESSALKEGRDRDFTMFVDEGNIGITFSIVTGRSEESFGNLEKYCNLKMYQTKYEEWILLGIDVDHSGKRVVDFRVFNKKWQHDPIIEKQLDRFKAAKMYKALGPGRKKVGRNEPCPCGSGLKYKKCCGK
jgi:hypothetical protein